MDFHELLDKIFRRPSSNAYQEKGLVPEQRCPACRTLINDGTVIAGAPLKAPVEHDLGLCYSCGAMLTFDSSGHLKVLDNTQWEKLSSNLQRLLLKAQAEITITGRGQRSRSEWEEPDDVNDDED